MRLNEAMFRISQFMQEISAPTPIGPVRKPPGPVVIWNLIRRCNLTCKHCYSDVYKRQMYSWLVYIHVLATFAFLLAHGVSSVVALRPVCLLYTSRCV